LVRDDVINTAQLSATPADDLVDFFNMEKKKRASNLLQDEKELLVELVYEVSYTNRVQSNRCCVSENEHRRVGDAREGI